MNRHHRWINHHCIHICHEGTDKTPPNRGKKRPTLKLLSYIKSKLTILQDKGSIILVPEGMGAKEDRVGTSSAINEVIVMVA